MKVNGENSEMMGLKVLKKNKQTKNKKLVVLGFWLRRKRLENPQ